jgi:hypothetical protein
MQDDQLRLSRRGILAVVGSGAASAAFAADLRVISNTDGGFTVSRGESVWTISGLDLRNHWGSSRPIEITEADTNQVWTVKVVGRVLAKTANLILSIRPDVNSWTIRGTVETALGRLGGQWNRRPSSGQTPILRGAVDPNRWSEAIGLRTVGDAVPVIELDWNLGLSASSQAGFVPMRGLRALGPLRLHPGEEGTVATMTQARLSGRAVMAAPIGPISFEAQEGDLTVIQGTDGHRADLIAKGQLAAGEARFRLDSCKVSRRLSGTERGQWELTGKLESRAQQVRTPFGRLEVCGVAEDDALLKGNSVTLQSFRLGGALVHAAIRLPLEAGSRQYADDCRLDFSEGARIGFTWGSLGSVEDDKAKVPLDNAAPSARLPLDKAKLRVARDVDMFRACFGFRGIALELRRSGARLVAEEGKPVGSPTLIVELSPQHIQEQAFARIAPQLPGRPLAAEEMFQVFDQSKREKLKLTIFADLEKQNPEAASIFGKFEKQFANAYREAWRKLNPNVPSEPLQNVRRRRRVAYPAVSTRDLEAIYVGPEGLITPLGRRIAREIAEKDALHDLPKLAELRLALGEVTVGDILRRRGWLPDPSGTVNDKAEANEVVKELMQEAAKLDPDMARVLANWKKGNPTTSLLLPEWQMNWPSFLLPGSQERGSLAALLNAASPTELNSNQREDLEKALQGPYGTQAPKSLPVEARAAGPTRLAFDFSERVKARSALQEAKWVPWSLSGLMAWKDLPLRVSSRVQAPRTAAADQELMTLLETRGVIPGLELQPRLKNLAQLLSREPGSDETAIELPARLLLSPDNDKRFRDAPAPAHGARTSPIWSATLRETPGAAFTLRAIHSPDVRPEALLQRNSMPDRGNQAGTPIETLFAMDDFDRHQIVVLSSLHGMPVLARRAPGGVAQTSQVAPPPDWKLRSGILKADEDEQALYVPRPLATRLLRLSPLGASLDLDATFVPPASLRRSDGGENAFDAYSVERWRSLIAGGREVTTEILYKGFLYPLGIRASLVKVTERRFLPWGNPQRPVAYLVQRIFIQVSNPTKTFPAVGQPFAGRGWPATAAEVLTRRTPDLLDPTRPMPAPDRPGWHEWPSGRLQDPATTGLVFWPRTAFGPRGNVRFRFTLDGQPEPVSMPLVFVDNQAAHDAGTMRALQRYYNAPDQENPPSVSGTNDEEKQAAQARQAAAWIALRRLEHAGVRRRYAEEGKPGDTTFETLWWDVRADSREELEHVAYSGKKAKVTPVQEPDSGHYRITAAMEGVDQPAFYPRCDIANIRHDACARFSGNPQAAMPVRFFGRFLELGLPILTDVEWGDRTPEATGVKQRDIMVSLNGLPDKKMLMREAFFTVEWQANKPLPKLGMGDNGDRGGGMLRPELNIAAIGRHGPIGVAKPEVTASNKIPDVNTLMDLNFVDDESATILGIVSLPELLNLATDALPPQLRDTVTYAGEAVAKVANEAAELVKDVIRQIENQPVLRDAYAPTLQTLRRLSAALVKVNPQEPETVPEAIAAGRAAAAALDRLAAAPLAPLIGTAEKALREVRGVLKGKADQVLLTVLRQYTPSDEVISNVAQVFAPPVAELLNDLRQAVAALPSPPPPEEQRRFYERIQALALGAATHAVQQDPMPETLVKLRQGWAAAILGEFGAIEKEHPWAKEVLDKTVRPSLTMLAALPVPAMLERIYAAVRLARGFDLRGALAALEDQGMVLLRGWAEQATGNVCTAAEAKVNDAVTALKKALLPDDIPLADCRRAACDANGIATSLCGRMWRLCGTLPVMTESSRAVAASLEALDRALRDYKLGSPCEAPFGGGLRTLDAARAGAFTAIMDWVKALREAAEAELDSAVVQAAGEVLAQLLEAVVPNNAPGMVWAELKSNLAQLIGETASKDIVEAVKEAQEMLLDMRDPLRTAKTAQELRNALRGLDAAAAMLRAAGQDAVASFLLMLVLPATEAANDAAAKILEALKVALDWLDQARNDAREPLRDLDKRLGLSGDEALGQLMAVRPLKNVGWDDLGSDQLLQEKGFVAKALAQPPPSRLLKLLELLDVWQKNPPGAVALVRDIDRRLLDALRRAALRLIDLDGLRAKLEGMLADIVPTKRTLEYDWNLPTTQTVEVGKLAKVKLEGLKLSANTTIDLTQAAMGAPEKAITAKMEGKLGDFDVEIPTWVTLRFSGMSFEAGTGRSSSLTTPNLKGVTPDGALVFLTALAAYLGTQEGGEGRVADPNGPYLVPRRSGGAGIQAGYRLNMGPLQMGNIALLDLALDAHAELPFNSDPGAVRILLSSPERPFLVVAAPHGGSGYVQIEAGPGAKGNKQHRQRLSVSLEWGGAAAVAYGPLKATGRVMTGIRVRQEFGEAIVPSFTFVAAFEGQIACFGVCGSFVVEMTYQHNRMFGQARLTYGFNVGPVKREFTVRVKRNMGGQLGDRPSDTASLEPLPIPGQPRIMLARAGLNDTTFHAPPKPPTNPPKTEITADVPAGLENWTRRERRYAAVPTARGRRNRA